MSTGPATAPPATGRKGRNLVSGHYAGAITRLVAFLIDWLIAFFSYTVTIAITDYILETFFSISLDTNDNRGLWWTLGLLAWLFLYFTVALAATARTPGKAIVGLRVVRRDGSPFRARKAPLRVIAFPLNFLVFGVGFLGIIFGKERRAWHDMIAGTTVVYDWGDRSAEMPGPLSRWMQRKVVEEGVADQVGADPDQAQNTVA